MFSIWSELVEWHSITRVSLFQHLNNLTSLLIEKSRKNLTLFRCGLVWYSWYTFQFSIHLFFESIRNIRLFDMKNNSVKSNRPCSTYFYHLLRCWNDAITCTMFDTHICNMGLNEYVIYRIAENRWEPFSTFVT